MDDARSQPEMTEPVAARLHLLKAQAAAPRRPPLTCRQKILIGAYSLVVTYRETHAGPIIFNEVDLLDACLELFATADGGTDTFFQKRGRLAPDIVIGNLNAVIAKLSDRSEKGSLGTLIDHPKQGEYVLNAAGEQEARRLLADEPTADPDRPQPPPLSVKEWRAVETLLRHPAHAKPAAASSDDTERFWRVAQPLAETGEKPHETAKRLVERAIALAEGEERHSKESGAPPSAPKAAELRRLLLRIKALAARNGKAS